MEHFEHYRTRLDRIHKSYLTSIITEAESTYIIPKNDTTLRRLHRKPNAPLGGEQLIKSYLEQLLILLLRSITSQCGANRTPSMDVQETPLVAAMKLYITARAEETVRVEDVCQAFGYSKSFLSRLFREHTGDSIAAFARKQKIKRAKQLIRESNLNFAQIAARLAFDDPQYFSRVFKQECGMTPTEYKNRAHI